METDTQTNQCIPDARWGGIYQQTKIPIPPRELVPGFFYVPHLGEACSSILTWGVLSAVLDVTTPDGPALEGSLSTGGTGVEVLVFSTPAMGASFSSCPMLGLMGSK